MASQPEPPEDRSEVKFHYLSLEFLDSLEELNNRLCSQREARIGRSNDQEGSESIDPNDPHLVSTNMPYGGPFLRPIRYLRLLRSSLIKLEELQANLKEELTKPLRALDDLILKAPNFSFSPQHSNSIERDIEGISLKISDVLCKVPFVPGKLAKPKVLYSWDDDQSFSHNGGKHIAYLPGIHSKAEDLTRHEPFFQVEQRFKELDLERKMCLLSFAVFPENREVHRTMLMYWWLGEGILPIEGAEETVREILKDFTDKKLVEPVEKRREVSPSSYKMTPFVHSSVIHLSKEIGLFEIYGGKNNEPSTSNSEMGKVCLVERSSSDNQEITGKRIRSLDIETVFNVSESYPDFTFKWFSEHSSDRKLIKLSKTVFKSLRVFYLGRWERTQKRHIQVQNHELTKCLKHLTKLRVLSLQGISTIRTLKSSVCNLHKLIVLDLRECSGLTKLPEKIDSLQNLVYLDMTGCYMLEWMPYRLALLKNIEVLKGFVVCDTIDEGFPCKLNHLKSWKKLRKLSINVNRDDITLHQLMEDIVELKALTSLIVTWKSSLTWTSTFRSKSGNQVGKQFIRTQTDSFLYEDSTKIIALPDRLKKLDLQRFPDEEVLPTWLQPHNLLHLEKLYIGGGTFEDFGDLPVKKTQCSVKILRLTSLPKLRVGWIELKQLYFPNLIFLEKYECPGVSLTPCDGHGIWRSDQD